MLCNSYAIFRCKLHYSEKYYACKNDIIKRDLNNVKKNPILSSIKRQKCNFSWKKCFCKSKRIHLRTALHIFKTFPYFHFRLQQEENPRVTILYACINYCYHTSYCYHAYNTTFALVLHILI